MFWEPERKASELGYRGKGHLVGAHVTLDK